jgi:hypothetical protein
VSRRPPASQSMTEDHPHKAAGTVPGAPRAAVAGRPVGTPRSGRS